MREIRSAALLGAGGVGAYFIWGLDPMPGLDFCVLAEGERAERLKKEGITINGQVWKPEVKSGKEAYGVDLLLVSVKYGALKDSLPMIRDAVGPDTIVISMMNGIDSEEIIGAEIGMEHMLYSIMKINAERVGHAVTFDPERTKGITFGEKGIREKTERVQAVENLFLRSGRVRYEISEDIITALWTKFASNIPYNLPQAVLGVPMGAYADSEHMAFLAEKLYLECQAVAAACGVEVKRTPHVRGFNRQNAMLSTLQDLKAGRHTEIDMFLGVLIRMAGEHGVSVPYSEYTYHAIKVLEEKNDGKFIYND